jgi:hypothetical protein
MFFETSFRAYLNIHPSYPILSYPILSYPILYKHHTILHLEKALKGEGKQRGGNASQGGEGEVERAR